MVLKKLSVGKGLQAYRLYSQPVLAVNGAGDTSGLSSADIRSVFYKRLLNESERVARQIATSEPAKAEDSTEETSAP